MCIPMVPQCVRTLCAEICRNAAGPRPRPMEWVKADGWHRLRRLLQVSIFACSYTKTENKLSAAGYVCPPLWTQHYVGCFCCMLLRLTRHCCEAELRQVLWLVHGCVCLCSCAHAYDNERDKFRQMYKCLSISATSHQFITRCVHNAVVMVLFC